MLNDGFYTIGQYIESKCTLVEKIQAIEAIQSAMRAKLLDSALNSADLSEYQMDDGQMKVKTAYRSPSEVQRAIFVLEQEKQNYINRVNGRVVVLKSGKF